jgi:membrane protease subunit HflK
MNMAWNQPGNGDGKDPWGGRNNQQGPPDLDEVLRQLQQRLGGIFGGKRGGGGSGGSGSMGGGASAFGIGIIAVVAVLLYGFAGFYIVDPAEEAVVMRFGEYNETSGPGPHWAPKFIDAVEKVNVQQVRRQEIGFRSESGNQPVRYESLMLTRDENIVDIQFAVLYRVKNARHYLFNVADPDQTLKDATESAIREVVGKSSMDAVLTERRSEVADEVQQLTQNILDRYETGLEVTSVNMQQAQPPEEVQEAFADAVRAREDEVRAINEARAYAADILPKARGDANALLERAEGYKQQVVNSAKGGTARFESVLKEYEKAPSITRDRLYLDAVESVLANTTKVVIDVKSGNNLMLMPLDKLIGPNMSGAESSSGDALLTPSSERARANFDATQRRRRDDRGRNR